MLYNVFIVKERIKRVHLLLESIPDYLYPFASEIEGRFVRGKKSYIHAVNRALQRYNSHTIGYRLIMYRGIFHFVGAVLFVIVATVFSKYFLGTETALYVLIGAAITALFFQEFYIHPRRYRQTVHKSFFDWLSWVVPMFAAASLISV